MYGNGFNNCFTEPILECMSSTHRGKILPIVDLQQLKQLPSFNGKYPEAEMMENVEMCGSKNLLDSTYYKMNYYYKYIYIWIIIALTFMENRGSVIRKKTYVYPWSISELKDNVKPIGSEESTILFK